MSRTIWTQCERKFEFRRYSGHPWRVVEGQHRISTRKLVDNDVEQALLEDLIEDVKPAKPHDEECAGYHYLLWTPFRYAPLAYGSRLGARDRSGIWYGSKSVDTAFAECAYYNLLFRAGSSADLGTFNKQLTAFNAPVASRKTADLTQPPFNRFEDRLRAPDRYDESQALGSALRDLKTEVILFKSARCPKGGTNVAVTSLSAFKNSKPERFEHWFCISSPERVEFVSMDGISGNPIRHVFRRADFEVDGKLPSPAS